MTFGRAAIAAAGQFPSPDSPGQLFDFKDQELLARLIDQLLATSGRFESCEGLPRKLDEAALALSADIKLRDAATALRWLSGGFENFLQLIAAEKFAHRQSLLHGDERHVGFLETSLGGLLLGVPSARPGLSEDEKAEIPKARIVKFDFNSKDLASQVFEQARRIRNEVHEARDQDVFTILRKAQVVFAAYLFATDQNTAALTRSLDPAREYLCGLQEPPLGLPFVVEPAIQSEMSEHALPFELPGGRVLLGSLVDAIVATEGPWTCALYGDPGAGKSTALAEMAHRLADRHLSDLWVAKIASAARLLAFRGLSESRRRWESGSASQGGASFPRSGAEGLSRSRTWHFAIN